MNQAVYFLGNDKNAELVVHDSVLWSSSAVGSGCQGDAMQWLRSQQYSVAIDGLILTT